MSITTGIAHLAAWIERAVERIAEAAERHPLLGLLLFSLAYAAATLARCLDKPLWIDELFTFYISRLPTAQQWSPVAMNEGQPPLFHILTHASMRLFGESSLAVRLPEMICVWLLCISLFFFVRRRCPAAYAWLALVLPLGTVAYEYAFEARPYGIVLGMAGVSLLAWQSAAEGRRRPAWLAVLAASLATGVASHFYGIQILLPLVVGEAIRAWERRKVDWGVAAAMGFSVLPLPFMAAIARTAMANLYTPLVGVGHAAARPSLPALAGFYGWLLQPVVVPLALAFVVLMLCSLMRVEDQAREEPARPPMPLPESAALAAYLFVPVCVLIVTALTTDRFYGRYAISAMLGLGGLFPCMLSFWYRGRALAPLVLSTSLALVWAAHTPAPPLRWEGRAVALKADSRLYPKLDDLPIVVLGWGVFPQLAHYSTPEVTARLHFLTDVETSRRTFRPFAQMGLAGARQVLPGHVVEYRPFVDGQRRFWIYAGAGTGAALGGWLPARLLADGWKLEVKAEQGEELLLLATRE
ncbi:MAG: glycosyltransferase family 39 protein [Bryobacteraceae bacterium]